MRMLTHFKSLRTNTTFTNSLKSKEKQTQKKMPISFDYARNLISLCIFINVCKFTNMGSQRKNKAYNFGLIRYMCALIHAYFVCVFVRFCHVLCIKYFYFRTAAKIVFT